MDEEEVIRTNSKKAIGAILILTLSLLGIVYAVRTYWSNEVAVVMREAKITLSLPQTLLDKGDLANFTALVTIDGVPQQAKLVTLCFNNGTSTFIEALTNSSGMAVLPWYVTASATFMARVDL